MKKFFLSLIAIISFQQISIAQQPMTISPGLVVSSPTAGNSGLRFGNLNSTSTASTTPTKVLSLDASGNVILGNAASGGGSTTAINVPVYANSSTRATAIPTASTGMLTYNSQFSSMEAFNGSAWIQLNPFTINSTNARFIVSQNTASGGIEANRFISQANSTVASPAIALLGPSHVIRYASGSGPDVDANALTQETTTGTQQTAASIVWKYYDNSPTPVGTTLFGYSAGVMTINGFTKLGNEATSTTSGVTSSVPSVKHKLLTGASAAGATITVPHGISGGSSKIVGLSVILQGFQGSTTTQLQFGPGYSGVHNVSTPTVVNNTFSYLYDDTNVYIERGGTTAGRTYKILITYIP